MERRIDVWQLSIVHLPTNYNTHCLYNKLVLTLTEDIIIQSEPEKQDKTRSWRKILKLVRFWIKNFSTRQILNQKILQRVRFWIKNFPTRQILN